MAFFPKKPLTPLEKGYIAPTPSATKVDGSGVVQPVSGTVTVNSGEGVDTSALAREQTLKNLLTELKLKADLSETQPISVSSLPLPSGATQFIEQYNQTELLTLIYEELQTQTKLLKKIYQ